MKYIVIQNIAIFVYFDSINRPKNLIKRAIELGLAGIAITDHEALCGHPEINFFVQEIAEEHPDFKVALGNEIYLTPNRESGQKLPLYSYCKK